MMNNQDLLFNYLNRLMPGFITVPAFIPFVNSWNPLVPALNYGGFPYSSVQSPSVQSSPFQINPPLTFRPIAIQNQHNFLPLGSRGGINSTMSARVNFNFT